MGATEGDSWPPFNWGLLRECFRAETYTFSFKLNVKVGSCVMEALQYGHVLVFLPILYIDQTLNAQLMALVGKGLGIEVETERTEGGS
ncbi:UNVERIFIED_CONTAM: hypothetical protein Sangu_0012500 [Sesamum angustifolium]|uniref:Uncharacterized protein n=1 Tax=Sesamum angustifolium TaxID=2727405 RepID=A0AAW2RGY8_9LAMI